jgi:hypothetical protein
LSVGLWYSLVQVVDLALTHITHDHSYAALLNEWLHLLVIVVAVAVVGIDAVLVLRAAEAHPRVLARAHARHGALAVVGALRLADGCNEERVRWRGERWREWVVEIQLANPGSQMPVKGAAG